MKRVLITGANGFTGSHLVQSLNTSDWQIIPMSHRAGGLTNEIILDLCHPDFPRVLQFLPPVQAVVHLAGRIGWDGSSRADLFHPNILATGQLLHWAKNQNPDCLFIFASAALICGEKNPHITAHCPLNTENDYLYSKWLAEELIKMSGIPHCILRIAGIFGKNGPTHLGLNKAIANVLQGTPPTLYGSGQFKRNYIYVKDLCRTITYCLDHHLTGTHLAAGTQADSMRTMLETLCRFLLPQQKPDLKPGSNGQDQIIDPSPILPPTRSFEQAMIDLAAT